MPVMDVYDIGKNKVAEITLAEDVFEADVNESAIYEVVKMQMANRRRGTASTKTRHDVRGGGKKPWRQKGTGRARAGTIRSPLWRGGGIVFGPHPRDYGYRLPKMVRRVALRSVLSLKFREKRIVILRDFPLSEIKTRAFKEVMDRFGWKRALFVIDQADPMLEKSSRNIQDVKMLRAEGLNVYDVLNHDQLVFLEPSVKRVEGALKS